MSATRKLPLWTIVTLLTALTAAWEQSLLAQPLGPRMQRPRPIGAPSEQKPEPLPTEGLNDYLTGLEALEAARADEAIVPLTRAIQADSEGADYYLARGVAHVAAEKLPQAVKDLERAGWLRPQDKQARLWMAVAVAMGGDFPRASSIYPFATNDLDESFVRQASHEYGEVAFRAQRNEVTNELLKTRDAAKQKIIQSAAQFAARSQARPGLEAALLTAARQQFERGDYAGAHLRLGRVLSATPEDLDALYLHARCALELGDYAVARTELTRVLTAQTDRGEAYLARALAAANLGDVRRAQADLATAERIDRRASADTRTAVERIIAAQAGAQASAAPMFAALDKLAHAGLPEKELRAEAAKLVKASNNRRRRYDEQYQDRLRELEDAVRASPRDPDRLTLLGQFLLDEASVRRERVEPRGPFRKFRYQTDEMEARELARAEELADQALGLRPDQVNALCLKAACRYWHQQYADAEKLVKQAVKLDPRSPRVLELLARVLEVASLQKSADAAALRRPTYLGSRDERYGDYIYTYTRWRYPSEAELRQAALLEEQSRKLAELALEQIATAAKIAAGKPEGYQLQGLYHWHKGELDQAVASYRQALERAPEQVAWRHNLAAIYDALGEFDSAFQERLTAANLVETTAGPLLANVWDLFSRTRFKSAREVLARAGDIDAADARVAAYLGVAAAAEERLDDAAGWFRLAMALEAARLSLAGKPLSPEAVLPLSPDDYGLYLGTALRLCKAYQALDRPDAARDVALEALPLAKRISGRDFSLDVPAALLPDPALDPAKVPEAENVASLFAWLQVAAGQSLVTLKNYEAAIAVLAPIHGWEQQMQNGVGAARLRGPVVYSSLYLARAYLAQGDLNNAQRYAQMVPRKRLGAGPSMGPFPELEDEGSRLQEEIARRRQGGRAGGY